MSRDETEDNHDIIELSREALQGPPAAAFCGGCCVTTPNTTKYVVLGDSDTMNFSVPADRVSLCKLCHFFSGLYRYYYILLQHIIGRQKL